MAKVPAKRKSIEEDTVILPYLVTEGVVGGLTAWLVENADVVAQDVHGVDDAPAAVERLVDALREDGRRLADEMATRADETYVANDDFAKMIHGSGNKGRNGLYSFAQHWLVAALAKLDDGAHKAVVDALPKGYASGQELPARPASLGR